MTHAEAADVGINMMRLHRRPEIFFWLADGDDGWSDGYHMVAQPQVTGDKWDVLTHAVLNMRLASPTTLN